jgi:tagatose-1,6-bisphosphate aldolase
VIDPAPGAGDADPGRRRRLLRLAGSNGIVAGIAIDHRDSLRVVLDRDGLAGIGDDGLRELKLRLAEVLAPAATAVMIDAELGSLALEAGVIPPSVGLIMPLEAQGYESGGDQRVTTLLAGFSPLAAVRSGADACKLLLPYRADDEVTSARQDELVRSTAAACHDLALPLVVEPVPYPRSTESARGYAAGYEHLVRGAVRRLQPLGPDLLKLPFPLPDVTAVTESDALAACRALDEACAGTPWVLLGAGVDTETFLDQIRLAGAGGASGFLAGRGIWGPALRADAGETRSLATRISLPAFEQCRAAADLSCRPLTVPGSP